MENAIAVEDPGILLAWRLGWRTMYKLSTTDTHSFVIKYEVMPEIDVLLTNYYRSIVPIWGVHWVYVSDTAYQ